MIRIDGLCQWRARRALRADPQCIYWACAQVAAALARIGDILGWPQGCAVYGRGAAFLPAAEPPTAKVTVPEV